MENNFQTKASEIFNKEFRVTTIGPSGIGKSFEVARIIQDPKYNLIKTD